MALAKPSNPRLRILRPTISVPNLFNSLVPHSLLSIGTEGCQDAPVIVLSSSDEEDEGVGDDRPTKRSDNTAEAQGLFTTYARSRGTFYPIVSFASGTSGTRVTVLRFSALAKRATAAGARSNWNVRSVPEFRVEWGAASDRFPKTGA
ncbi:hypothetical protein RhiXN_07800 [Rhizoctonia solani]|uniref:Uncharacterized protein n=1 Tax=Rhizoctonia solani TaxID=456999 RepID=A0A8H8SYS6_9AGAM|nr:uncharacterized protein RhiXN_07800 [Rhizoctonia solani]QRW22764.1 hypothetical protein RhiXN_07800 [Rhizoctonia solani]